MSSRFVHVRSPYLVPFTSRFRVRRAPTTRPRQMREDRANEAALADSILRMRKLQGRLPGRVE